MVSSWYRVYEVRDAFYKPPPATMPPRHQFPGWSPGLGVQHSSSIWRQTYSVEYPKCLFVLDIIWNPESQSTKQTETGGMTEATLMGFG